MSDYPTQSVAIIGGGIMGTMFHELLPNSVVITRASFSTTNWSMFDTIIFAIRPQDFKLLSPMPLADKLIISVMAGIRRDHLSQLTGSNQIIRCMPNTTVRIKMGMTVWCKTETVSPTQVTWFTNVLADQTKLLEVTNDDWIDKATAISGSGPAYLLTVLKVFIESAQQLGFSFEQSKLLVEQSCRGSLALMDSANTDLTSLVEQLVTKGGTTERALAVFEKHHLAELWNEAVQANYQRTKELSQ